MVLNKSVLRYITRTCQGFLTHAISVQIHLLLKNILLLAC